MRAHVSRIIVVLIGAWLLAFCAHAAETNSADVIVYGSTPGGFCAAISAAREGASVVLLEPTGHIGGMNTGGLSFSDSNQMYRETLMGLLHEWHLRIKATWMLIGQSAGIAAAMAADRDVAVQDLPYADLRTRLLAQGQVLELPGAYAPLDGIVLDDPEAELVGTWGTSSNFTPYVGDGYRYTGAAGTPNDGSATRHNSTPAGTAPTPPQV